MIDSIYEVKLPYSTGELPGIGGRLRARMEHFEVTELPLYEPQDEGQHLYICLTKEGLTTKVVQERLAKLFDLKSADIGFAGMKDKFARTTQTFSLSVGHQDATFADQAAARIEDALPVQVIWARFHHNKLRSGHLRGNRFRIVVSEVELDQALAVSRAKAIAARLRRRGLPNYFGPQRFGHGGANIRRGEAVLLRKQYVKDRWLRRFFVSSYQSYLCNRYLAKRLLTGSFDHLLAGDIAKKYETGGLFDVENLAREEVRYQDQEISFTAPMFGPKMRQANGPSGELEKEILGAVPVTMEHFRKARSEGTRRLGRLLLNDLVIAEERNQDSCSVAVDFSLPKGAFATTVMREIMKANLSSEEDGSVDE